MSSHRTGIRTLLIALTVVGVGLVSTPVAAGSSNANRTISVVNGAGAQGEPVADKLRSVLYEQRNFDQLDQESLLETGSSHGVTTETLRDGDQRATHVEEFEAMMRDAGVDAIFVLDVFAGKAQLVSIGPKGREQSDERTELVRGVLVDHGATELLNASIRAVEQVWNETKRAENEGSGGTSKRASASGSNSGGSSSSSGSSGSTGRKADGRTDQGRSSAGGFEPSVNIEFGGVGGRHQLNVSTPANSEYNVQQANQFLGAQFALHSILGTLDERQAAVGLDVFGVYAPFRTLTKRPSSSGGNSKTYSSSISQLGIDFNYLRRLAPRLTLQVTTGFEALSFRLEQNPNYTGNRYAQFRFLGNVQYRPVPLFSVTGGGGLAPLVESDMSGGAFGDSAFAPGILGEAGLNLHLSSAISVALDYRLYHYDLVFRDPNVIDTQANVADTYHVGSLRVQYAF